MPRFAWIVLMFAMLVVLAGSPELGAEDRAGRGRSIYEVHCQSCHGATGRGDGPMASEIKTGPPDLTGLAERNEGKFDTRQVAQTIDGRNKAPAHGPADMPVWGMALQDQARDHDQEAEVHERILDLVAYLESIQEPSRD